ncbi:MAG: hypothetical protein ACLS48_02910 [[Eubacterium] siraeum]
MSESLGNKAMIVMLVIAAIPYVARMTNPLSKRLTKALLKRLRQWAAQHSR